MSLVSGVFSDYVVPAALSRPMVIGAGCMVAIPALELIKRVSEDYDLSQRYNIPAAHESESAKSARLQKKDQLQNTMLVRGIGAAILGACAFNLFPGSGAVGLLGCLTYSRFNWKNEANNANSCYSLVVPGFALQFLSDYKKQIAKAIFSQIKIATLAIGSFIYKTAMKVRRFGLAILHGMRSITKVIIAPFKKLGSLLKIFKPFIRHPKLGLGFLAGLVCLIGCVKYGHRVIGAAGVIANAVSNVIQGLWNAGAGMSSVVRPLGTVLSYIPSVLMQTVSGIKTVVYFIFHPVQAITEVKASA